MELCTRTTEKQGYKYRVFAWPRGFRMAFTGKGKRVLPRGRNVWIYSLLLVLALAFPSLASLPTYVQASGSGLAGFNGTYAGVDSSGASYTDKNGQPYYVLQSSSYTAYLYLVLAPGYGYGWFFDSILDNASGHYMTSPMSSVSSPVGQTFTDSNGYPGPSVAVAPAPAAPAPTVSSLAVSPSSLTGSSSSGQTVTLLVTLSAAAPTGGATVTFSSTTAGGFSGNVGFTTQLTVPYGSTSASEPATIGASSSGGSVSFAAAYNSTSAGATVTIGAPPAAASGPPATLYVYGGGNAADNGTYKLIGFQSGSTTNYYYTLNGVTSGTSGPGIQTGGSCVLLGHINAATGGNAAGGPPYADYSNSSGTDPTSAGSPYAPYSGTPSSYAPAPTVSTTPQSTGGGGSTSTAPGSPGVSASLSPYTVGAGGSSVLRWDTSGATTVTVTGVPTPSASGTLNVSATSTTVYTITATNSSGTTTYQVTLTVDPSLPVGSAGSSTFTPGTTVSSSGGSFTPTTLPGLSLPSMTLAGVSIPGFASLPALTLPGLTIPAIALPGLSLPGATAPGDLKIGIPGIGSIGIPTGWLTQVISAAINPASIAQQLATYNASQFNALATYNAGAAITTAVNSGTQAVAQVTQVAATNTQGVIASTSTATQGVITSTSTATQNTINGAETKSVTDFNGMLSTLLQALFVPSPSVLNQFEGEQGQFLNWGPYSFITSFQQCLSAPPGDGLVGGVGLAIPSIDVNADASSTITVDPTTGTVTGGAPGFSYFAGAAPPTPFNFQQVTSLPGWAFVRLLLGAGVWVLFITGVMRIVQPKQVL